MTARTHETTVCGWADCCGGDPRGRWQPGEKPPADARMPKRRIGYQRGAGEWLLGVMAAGAAKMEKRDAE